MCVCLLHIDWGQNKLHTNTALIYNVHTSIGYNQTRTKKAKILKEDQSKKKDKGRKREKGEEKKKGEGG